MTITFNTAINEAIAQSLQTARVLLILITPSSETPIDDPPQWPHMLPALAANGGIVNNTNTVGLQLVRDSPDYVLFSQIFHIEAAADRNTPYLVFIHQGAVRLVLKKGDDDTQIANVYNTPLAPSATSSLSESTTNASSTAESTLQPAQSDSVVSTSAAVTSELSTLGPESITTPSVLASASSEPTTHATSDVSKKNNISNKTKSTSPARSATPAGADIVSPATSSPTTNAATGPAKKPNRKLSHGSPQQQQERARILRLLESDRLERNMQQKIAREARLSQSQEKRPVFEDGDFAVEPETIVPTPRNDADSCALQIRLFDGAPVKHIFRATETLIDVRTYLDKARPDMAAAPYAFFLPLAKKTFGDGEEAQELRALGLVPSATLVIKPPTSTMYSAYASERARPVSQIGRAISAVSNALYVFLGIGYTPPPPPESQSPSVDIGLVRQAFEQRVPSVSGGGASTNGSNSAVESGSEEPHQVYINSSASSSSAAINKKFKIIQTFDDTDKSASYNGNHLSLQDDDKKNDKTSSN